MDSAKPESLYARSDHEAMDNMEVALRIRSLASLFDALDPAPLHQKALNRDAERYILGNAGADRSTEPIRLLIHLPESLRAHAAEVSDAIHDHFRRAHEQGERIFRRRLRIGGVSLGVALGVLAGSIWLRSLLRDIEGRALVQGIEEGLLILGWVAMWRPVEILLFEHWESHQDHAMLQRLASIPIEFVFPSGTSRQEDEAPDDR